MFNRSPVQRGENDRKSRRNRRKRTPFENSVSVFLQDSRKRKGWACSILRSRKKRREEVASVRFPRKGGREREGSERMDKRWTSFTHRRPTYLANESQGWRYKGLVAVCRDKLDSSWQFEFILELGFACNSSFDLRTCPVPYFSPTEFSNSLSNFQFNPMIVRYF